MEKIDDSINARFRTNRSYAPFKINYTKKETGRNNINIFDKDIYYSKTESNNELNKKNKIIKTTKEKNKSDYFYSSQKIKNIHFREENKKQKFENKNATNLKFSDINRYINNAHNINIYNNKTKDVKPKNLSLNNYFELNKIKQSKKSMNNIYNDINIYHKSFIQRKNENNFRNRKHRQYSETERIMMKNNTNNNDINLEDSGINQKEKQLLKLENILEELKSKHNDMKNELIEISKENSELEKKEDTKYNDIYINIKNILNNTSKYNINDKNINTKLYKSYSLKEKCKYLRKIYLEKKLQKNLIEKINALYINSYNTMNDADINAGTDNNLNNLLNWIISLVENKDYLTLRNNSLMDEIKEKMKEKDMYKINYSNWANIFCANTKDEIIQNINELIKEQNINNNEKIKMIKMLFNNKQNSKI